MLSAITSHAAFDGLQDDQGEHTTSDLADKSSDRLFWATLCSKSAASPGVLRRLGNPALSYTTEDILRFC